MCEFNIRKIIFLRGFFGFREEKLMMDRIFESKKEISEGLFRRK